MPGFAVVERGRLLKEAGNEEGDTLDTLLSFLTIHHEAEINEENEVRAWTSKRSEEKLAGSSPLLSASKA